jgi:hypothetical protein
MKRIFPAIVIGAVLLGYIVGHATKPNPQTILTGHVDDLSLLPSAYAQTSGAGRISRATDRRRTNVQGQSGRLAAHSARCPAPAEARRRRLQLHDYEDQSRYVSLESHSLVRRNAGEEAVAFGQRSLTQEWQCDVVASQKLDVLAP